MIAAREALERLKEGNRRFVANQSIVDCGPSRRAALVLGQEPFAVILGCSDSRVPAEIVFDQGMGDLFIIRVAGNIVAPSQIGSIEFAATRFRSRLVVVMGHSGCGAVSATLDELLGHAAADSRGLRSIVDRIRPSLTPLVASSPAGGVESLMHDAVRANLRAAVEHVRHDSPLLESLIQRDGLLVVGAEYSLESGTVSFFDDEPVRF